MVLIVGGSASAYTRWRGSGIHFGSAMDAGRNIDRMIGELQKKVQQSPQDASAHYALAHAYFTKGQFSEGESELKRVLDLQPQNTRARMDMGAAYLRQEQPERGAGGIRETGGTGTGQCAAHAGLGVALAEQGNHEACHPRIQERVASQTEGSRRLLPDGCFASPAEAIRRGHRFLFERARKRVATMPNWRMLWRMPTRPKA